MSTDTPQSETIATESLGYTTVKIEMPTVPEGDNQAVASGIANYVMARAAELSVDLRDFLRSCADQAPRTTKYGYELNYALNRAVAEWLFGNWPE